MRDGIVPLRMLGGALALAGLVLAFAPTLVSDPGPAADSFAAIERRIPWGLLLGVGAFLVARTQLKPWSHTLASFVFWVVIGILVARGIGLALDGADSGMQWVWVLVEVIVIAGAGAFLARKRNV